jgi:hypothetical protein
MTDDSAGVGPVERGVRPLREGEVMGAYMEFDRTADRAWSSADYLVKFGLYVSRRTAEANTGAEALARQQTLALSIMLDHYSDDPRMQCLRELLPEWMGPNTCSPKRPRSAT